MVIGDFNSILSVHESVEGHLPPRLPCEEFRAALDNCGIIHVHVRGPIFT